jgi:hypothetical protein
MADELFDGVCFAMDIQDSGFGTPDATIAALSGTINQTHGCVLGDKGSGDAESGITLPTIAPKYRDKKDVDDSYTQSADSFIKALVEGFSITFPLQGNGADAGDPTAGNAIPDLGIWAIWRSLGMLGANGAAAPDYKFTPEYATTYSTIKLWYGDFSIVFSDCLVDSASLVWTPGDTGLGLMTANIKVGTFDPADFTDGVAFPTVTYGFQSSLSAPAVEGVAFTWGQVRGFENLTVNINNTVEEFGDSNVATTGVRQSQTKRLITVDGTLYINATDSDFAFQNAVSASAPTTDLSFQVGDPDVGGAETSLNAYKVEVNNLQAKSIKHNRIGTALAVELSGAKATSTTAGTEFMFEYN